MATFGIEGIRYFDKLRAAGYAASDLRYVFNVCNGLLRKLESRGHTKTFYYANDDCWETDIRSSFQGGGDNDYADNVDLFFIYTHGNHDSKGNIQLGYNVKKDKWLSNSAEWCLGEHQVEWVMAYACSTVDLEQFGTLYNIFQGLHGYCGAWGRDD
ncbi:MAG: hypothetical protein IPM07_25195 [Anaerolineales bacterium]|nr:hypothetical protein [Anaerolineales bacterium]